MSDKDRKLDVKKIAKGLGGKVVGKIPKPKGGFFGAMKTARDAATLQKARLKRQKPKGKK